jgi:hypothetical protein
LPIAAVLTCEFRLPRNIGLYLPAMVPKRRRCGFVSSFLTPFHNRAAIPPAEVWDRGIPFLTVSLMKLAIKQNVGLLESEMVQAVEECYNINKFDEVVYWDGWAAASPGWVKLDI